MPRPVKYNKPRTIKFSETQDNTLNKLSSYKINVAQFIRDAVKEKIKREYNDLLPKPKKEYCPFSGNTIEI
jgi:hypothetical protein